MKHITKKILRKREKRALKRALKTKWRDIRLYILQRDNYICQQCNKDLRAASPIAQAIHHVIPRQYKELFYNENNLLLLCSYCHHWSKNGAHQNSLYWSEWFKNKFPDRYAYLMLNTKFT